MLCVCVFFLLFLFSLLWLLLLLFLVWFWLSQSILCSSNMNGISAHTHYTYAYLKKTVPLDFYASREYAAGKNFWLHRYNVKLLNCIKLWKRFRCLVLCCSDNACSEWKSFAQMAVCPCSNNNNHNEKIEMFNILFKNWIEPDAKAK